MKWREVGVTAYWRKALVLTEASQTERERERGGERRIRGVLKKRIRFYFYFFLRAWFCFRFPIQIGVDSGWGDQRALIYLGLALNHPNPLWFIWAWPWTQLGSPAQLFLFPFYFFYNLGKNYFSLKTRVKYILTPQTTILSSNGPSNYQCLDSGPQTTTFWFFGPICLFILSILIEIGQKFENTPPLIVGISKCRRDIFGILFRIDRINGRMGPKNQKVVVWEARI
jgi:hypothetical protein